MPQEKYDLADFQALVLKFGPGQFNPKNNNPLQYFQVLIHSQQFEQVSLRDPMLPVRLMFLYSYT